MNSLALRRAAAALFVSLFVAFPLRVLAGPPLICHPYDIAGAKSLPADPRLDPASTYDRANLVADTLVLLKADTPILVRMETLRRAAIYATGNLRAWRHEKYTDADRELAAALIARLRERTTVADATAQAHALFDLGFFAETLRQAEFDPALDGYPLLVKASETLKDNPAVEFALALATARSKNAAHLAHLAKARALAKPGTQLAANLESHFGKS